ncbi:ion transporter [Roseibium sp.]|uniref:ion transporter n=1 Tax=Roseibium sp. TaxID=1936156 RepID=UPI003A97A263
MEHREIPEPLRRRLDRVGHLVVVLAAFAFAVMRQDAVARELADLRDLLGWTILAVMALEITFRFSLEGIEATRRLWNVFDAVVVLVAALTQTPVLVVIRLVFVIRIFPFHERIRMVIRVGRFGQRIFRDLARAAVVLLAGLLALSLLAGELLADLLANEFGTPLKAMETLIRIVIADLETLSKLVHLAGDYPLIWIFLVLPWLLVLFLALMLLTAPFVDEAIAIEDEAEVAAEALSEMRLMQLETEMVQKEIAVEAEAERLLIRAETNRILKEIGRLKDEMSSYRHRYRR